MLLLLLALALAADPTPPSAPTAEQRAEFVRLDNEIGRLAERNAWSGVERMYEDLEKTGMPLTHRHHVLGAEAARSIGDVALARERFTKANGLEETREVLDALWAIDAAYGRVMLGCDPGRIDLEVDTPPFQPDRLAAIEFAQKKLKSDGVFDGYLPEGSYAFGTQAFTVRPRVASVRIDLRETDEDTGTPRPGPKVKPEPAPQPEPAPKPELAPKPAPEPRPEPVPKVKPEPAPRPVPEPRPEPVPKVKPEPAPRPVPEPRPAPEPKVKPEPAPRPVPEPRPAPEPKVEPEPRPVPAPRPEPAPKVKPVRPDPTLPDPSEPGAPIRGTGAVVVEFRGSLAVGDVSRAADMWVATQVDGSVRSSWIQEGPFRHTGGGGGLYVGFQPIPWLDIGALGSVYQATKELNLSVQRPNGSQTAPLQTVPALVTSVQIRGRVSLPKGVFRPYGAAGLDLRVYEGFAVTDTEIAYPTLASSVVPGALVAGGAIVYATPMVGFLVEGSVTANAGRRARSTQVGTPPSDAPLPRASGGFTAGASLGVLLRL